MNENSPLNTGPHGTPAPDPITFTSAGRGRTTARLGDIESDGSGKREARSALLTALQGATSGAYEPALVTVHGVQILVWREPSCGWSSAIVTDPGIGRADVTPGSRTVRGPGSGTRSERETVIRAARSHAAQTAWQPSVHDDAFLAGCGFGEGEEDRRCVADLRAYFRWQRAYATAIEDGHAPEEARAVADATRWTTAAGT